MKTAQIWAEQSSVLVLNRSGGSTAYSLILWAFSIFILINIAFSFADQIHEQHTGAYVSCDCLTNTYEAAKFTPNIVLFGSSVMRKPFFLADCQHTNYMTDYEHYCWSQTLQNIIMQKGLTESKVFNFAIDGEMVSDAFLINSKLLQGAKVPKWIVYGITPRDLMDNLLSSETSTPIFDRLFTVKDICATHAIFAMTINEKLNLMMERFCFLYDKRKQTQNIITNIFSGIKEEGLPKTFLKLVKFQSKVRLQKALTDQEAWKISIEEYRKRYSTFNKVQFEKQSSLLKRFCEESKRKGIKVFLINMPLTKENIDLLPRGAYEAYYNAIAEIARLPSVNVLDLQNSKEFPKAYYCDTAHLNQEGAHRLEIIISDALLALEHRQTNPLKIESINNGSIANTAIDDQLTAKTGRKTLDGLASWWLTKAYYAGPKTPEVVVLGDSRFASLYGADVYVYNKTIDITGDHRCRVLEHDINGLLDTHWRVFIGALPKVTIQDLLFMSRSLFSSEHKPNVVILGFSPKDFVSQNNHLQSEAFAFFSEYGKHDSAVSANNALKNMQKIEYDFKRNGTDYIQGASSLMLGKPFERICPGEISINSGDGYIFSDDTKQYRTLYSSSFTDHLKAQLDVLDSLLSYLAIQNIKVVAFNLPITKAHRQLLPINLSQLYIQGVTEICRKNHADFIDLNTDWQAFNDKDFIDSTHLNLFGGLKLTRPIAIFAANKFHWRTFRQLRQDENRKMY